VQVYLGHSETTCLQGVRVQSQGGSAWEISGPAMEPVPVCLHMWSKIGGEMCLFLPRGLPITAVFENTLDGKQQQGRGEW